MTRPPVTASGHAFLAPSAAFRWGKCPLAAALEAAYPSTEDGPEALEGTCAHWVLQSHLEGRPVALDDIGPNGVPVTFEMLQSIPLVVRLFERTLGPNWRAMLRIEEKVQIPWIHPTHCAGTPDYFAWAQLPNGRVLLFLLDFKFGRVVVEAYRNPQLVTYYAGVVLPVLQRAGMDFDQMIDVVFAVVQPRASHRLGSVRTWQCVGSDLRADINVLRVSAEQALLPNPPARPGKEQCRDCSGRHACEALQRDTSHACSKAEESTPYELSPHALGLELKAIAEAEGKLKARKSGLEAQADAWIRQGKQVPFWRLDSTSSKLAWTVTNAQAITFGTMVGKHLAKPPEPVTPTQAIELGIDENLIVGVVAERKPGATKLVADDGTDAARVFG